MGYTLKDVAERAGVSYATVSRAINNHENVNEKTRKRIIKIAKDMGYKPNAIAQGLVKKETKTVGLIIPDIMNPFFPEIALGLEEAAEKAGYNVFLCNTNYLEEREKKYLDLLLQKQVDGLIISPCSDKLDYLDIINPDVKLVFINRNINIKRTSIIIDNFTGAKMAVKHLVECGHKKIAFVGKDKDISTNRERLRAYQEAMNEHGIGIKEEYIVSGNFKRESGYFLMKKLLTLKDRPTAVFAYNDHIALGIMQAIREANLEIPDDIAVVGFDDIEFASLPEIQLTTVAQPKYELGRQAFETLYQQIREGSNNISKTVLLRPQLIVRNTS